MTDAGLAEDYRRSIERQAGLNERYWNARKEEMRFDPMPMKISKLDEILRKVER